MLRRLRSILFVLVAAVLGAVLGRLAFQARERMDAGAPVSSLNLAAAQPRVQDIIPGLVAAFRVQDAPWSWFRIPGWLAALVVNLGAGAVGGDFTAIRERAERMAFDFAGLDARDFGLGGDHYDDLDGGVVLDGTSTASTTGASWDAPPPPPPPTESPSTGSAPSGPMGAL